MQKALAGFLPNGTLINGVANFYTSTKPTARVDGSALVIGDLWVNPSTGVQGFWNGTYWLSTQRKFCYSNSTAYSLIGTTGSGGMFCPLLGAPGLSFLERVLINYRQNSGTLDASNLYTFTFQEMRSDGIGVTAIGGSFVCNSPGTPTVQQGEIVINTIFTNTSATPLIGLNAVWTVTGTPGSVRYNPIAIIRDIL